MNSLCLINEVLGAFLGYYYQKFALKKYGFKDCLHKHQKAENLSICHENKLKRPFLNFADV